MTKVLAHISYDNKTYLGLLKYLSLSQSGLDVNITSLHERMYDVVSELNPEYIILSAEEYSQEFHDFIIETKIKLFLHISRRNDENMQEIVDYIDKNKPNITFISSRDRTWLPTQRTIYYDKLYDHELFYANNLLRNNKIAVLLHDKETNEKLLPLLYPNKNLNLICFNNKDFDHPQNLGVLSDIDLAKILNTFRGVVDLTEQFALEAKACGCPYIDIENLEYNIENFIVKNENINLDDHTIASFVENILIPHMNRSV